jgi:four helix bundle protein
MGKFAAGFRKLIAWQKAHELRLEIYKLTRDFPRDEIFALTSQLRRAAHSIAAQIAEGSRMPTMNHRKLYYDRAYASAAEVDDALELAADLGYLKKEQYDELLKNVNHVSALLHALSHSCANK